MDTSCYFIPDKAIFGCSPSQESVYELEKMGVRYFVDLTTDEEKVSKVKPYKTKYTYISYPIVDRHIPTNLQTYAKFIIELSHIIEHLRKNEKVYINCRAGLGRSGVVAASILCYITNTLPDKSIDYISRSLDSRKVLKDKWRKIGAPQTCSQKKFIYKFFFPLNFYKSYKNASTYGFSTFSQHSVQIENVGVFPTAEAAFQSFKNPSDPGYVTALRDSRNGHVARTIGNRMRPSDGWDESKLGIMEYVLRLKYEQHPEIKHNLISSGLRPLIEHTQSDSYWGDNGDGTGKNMLGILLMKLRKEYYIEYRQE